MTKYETFEHGADMGIRGWGKDIPEAFENCAKAMFSLEVDNFESIKPDNCRTLACSSFDLESLLVAWLNALLAESDIEHLMFSAFKVRIRGNQLEGTACGETFDPARHEAGIEVKGATYTELNVMKQGEFWFAQCVVDV
jgi:SHS2 domain-containing protein